MVYKFFRRYQQPVMIAFSVITIISFIGFYSKSDFLDKGGSGRDAVIYGRNIPLVQFQRGTRKADLCLQLAGCEGKLHLE